MAPKIAKETLDAVYVHISDIRSVVQKVGPAKPFDLTTAYHLAIILA